MKRVYIAPKMELLEINAEDMLANSIIIDTTHPGGTDQLCNEETDCDIW